MISDEDEDENEDEDEDEDEEENVAAKGRKGIRGIWGRQDERKEVVDNNAPCILSLK